MRWFKKSNPDELELQLRSHRSQPPDQLTRSLARSVTPPSRQPYRRPRFALAGGLSAVALTTFALAGGVGAAHDAVGGTASLVNTAFFHDTHHSHPGDGHGNPGDDQYGNHCDHWFDQWNKACQKDHHGGGNGGGDNHGGNGKGDGGGNSGGGGNKGGGAAAATRVARATPATAAARRATAATEMAAVRAATTSSAARRVRR